MKFSDLESRIKPLWIFNLNDVRKINPGFHRQQFSYWQNKGYIRSLAGGYYALADRSIDEAFLFMMANQLYEPSYVSLESALAFHQVIPESVMGVTSITSRKTRHFDSPWGVFSYRTIKPGYLFGYQVTETSDGKKYRIARMEKAILDTLYLNFRINSILDFEGLRWDKEQLRRTLDQSLLEQYLTIFNKKALVKRATRFKEYLDA